MLQLDEIGVFYSDAVYTQQAPRQGVFTNQSGVVQLKEKCNFEQALTGLENIRRIWLIWGFHQATNWKALVSPPHAGGGRKIGVFATRSPHRPNHLGISAVKLDKIEGLKLFVSGVDLLSGTPVYDIKPYVPEADAFSDSSVAWKVPSCEKQLFIHLEAQQQIDRIKALGGPDLEEVSHVQLITRDINAKTQRLTEIAGSDEQILAFRTWRVRFRQNQNTVEILEVFSGYSAADLADQTDPYGDKTLHFTLIAEKTCKSNIDGVY